MSAKTEAKRGEPEKVRELCEQLNPIPDSYTIPSREEILARGPAPIDARELVPAQRAKGDGRG